MAETLRGRPRDTGREESILEATIELLSELGYDRLTMEAVASRARAGKATLYRRWAAKSDLVVDALLSIKSPPAGETLDTGTLRGDLLAMCCGGAGTLSDRGLHDVVAGVVTAMRHDPELKASFVARFIEPGAARFAEVLRRARERGELRPGIDVELVEMLIPGLVVFRTLLTDEPADPAFVQRVIDEVVLPLVETSGTATAERGRPAAARARPDHDLS